MNLTMTPGEIKKEKVTIELNSSNVPDGPPEIGPPSAGIYSLIPRQQPELAKMVVRVVWQSNSKALYVSIKETPDLGVYRWMEYMESQHKQAKEGPFVDLNENALSLKMFDSQNRVVAVMQFKNLNYAGHSCEFVEGSTDTLVHHLTISYQECEKSQRPTTDTSDKEWQSVKA